MGGWCGSRGGADLKFGFGFLETNANDMKQKKNEQSAAKQKEYIASRIANGI